MVVPGSMSNMKTHVIQPKPASTVIIVREAGRGLKVCLLKRSRRNDFMPGRYVFPGGALGEEDRDALWGEYAGLDDAQWIHKLGRGMPKVDILPYGIAAIRETFEEAGILLVRRDGHWETDLQWLLEMRRKGELQPGWLKEWVAPRGWMLAISSLYPWAHWVTPEVRSKRFDTRFFLTLVPREVKCIPDGREITQGVWIEPREALLSNLKGHMLLSPPTLVTLHELLVHREMESLEGELESRRWGRPRCPRLVSASEGVLVLLPWDPMYDDEVDPGQVRPGEVLPVGEPFSRMWLHAGIWRPVAV